MDGTQLEASGGGVRVWFSTAQSTELPAHFHSVVELNILMTGSCRYQVGDEEWRVQAGQFISLPEKKPHVLLEVSSDIAFWVVELSLNHPIVLRGEVSKTLSSAVTHLVNPSDSWRKQFVQSLKRLWLRPNKGARIRYEETLYQALARVDTKSFEPLAPPHDAVVRARNICERDDCPVENVESLARKAGISSSRLAHLFQKELGVSPLQYRNFSRLQHFIQICDLQTPSLLRAALTAGFGSYPQFHRIFQQVTGESPSEHLKWLLTTDDVEASITLGDEKNSR